MLFSEPEVIESPRHNKRIRRLRSGLVGAGGGVGFTVGELAPGIGLTGLPPVWPAGDVAVDLLPSFVAGTAVTVSELVWAVVTLLSVAPLETLLVASLLPSAAEQACRLTAKTMCAKI